MSVNSLKTVRDVSADPGAGRDSRAELVQSASGPPPVIQQHEQHGERARFDSGGAERV